MKKIFGIRVGGPLGLVAVSFLVLGIVGLLLGLRSSVCYFTTQPVDQHGTTISVVLPNGWGLRFHPTKRLPIRELNFEPSYQSAPWYVPQWASRWSIRDRQENGSLQIIYRDKTEQPIQVSALVGNVATRTITTKGGGTWVAIYIRSDHDDLVSTYKEILGNIRVHEK